ncbi:MAG: cytochrome c biogenesis protein CcdA [Deltaproteobacteria bacterium]|jgi:cytochrome c-type biogenesis protein|nr:cytochrome c biogenesis protein CcdA [Deltaproteobacteria bacterium]
MIKVDVLAAWTAGFLTFFTPCTLPLIPAWFALIIGRDPRTAAEAAGAERLRAFLSVLFFSLGFGFVFVSLGTLASALGDFLWEHQTAVRFVGATVMVVFGLHLLGLIAPAFMLAERRFQVKARPAGLLGAFLVGMAFAAGWTPCSGPVLGAMLSMAAADDSLRRGATLLAFYSLGLSFPFLALSLLWGRLMPRLARLNRFAAWSSRALGVLMLVLAGLVYADRLSLLNFGR